MRMDSTQAIGQSAEDQIQSSGRAESVVEPSCRQCAKKIRHVLDWDELLRYDIRRANIKQGLRAEICGNLMLYDIRHQIHRASAEENRIVDIRLVNLRRFRADFDFFKSWANPITSTPEEAELLGEWFSTGLEVDGWPEDRIEDFHNTTFRISFEDAIRPKGVGCKIWIMARDTLGDFCKKYGKDMRHLLLQVWSPAQAEELLDDLDQIEMWKSLETFEVVYHGFLGVR